MASEPRLWLALGWDEGDAEDGSLLPCGFGVKAVVGIWMGVGFGLGSRRGRWVGDPQPMALEAMQWLALGWDAGDAEDGSLLSCGFGADVEAGIRLGWDLGWGLQVLWVGDPQLMALVSIGLGCR